MNPPTSNGSGPSASTIGLAVLLAAIMVGGAAITWFLSPASADPGHLSGLCKSLQETRADALAQALNLTGEAQQAQVNRAWAAEELYQLEDC